MKFLYKDSSRVNKDDIKKDAEGLFEYIDSLNEVGGEENYISPEGFINLPSDQKILETVKKITAEKNKNSLKYIFLLGIGGSSLGTQAIYDAMNLFADEFSSDKPKIFFFDTINPVFLDKAIDFIKEKVDDLDEILLTLISKSGTTTETIVNFEVIFNVLEKKFNKEEIFERVLTISDKDSPLWDISKKYNIQTIEIPDKIVGRFSVFSPAGILPITAAGFDMGTLLYRADKMKKSCLNKNIDENPALLSALITHRHFEEEMDISNTFFFNNELESIGIWYRQLVAESLGKTKSLDGHIVNTGITPTVSVGTSDLHSVAQLYLGGPKNKITTFVWLDIEEKGSIPENLVMPLVHGIEGRSPKEILSIIYESTKKAYKKKGLPYMEVILEDFPDIGAFLQFKMFEIVYLAKLLNVDAFNQPAVELYKEEIRKLLK